MNTSYLLWVIVILCLLAVIFVFRGPIVSFFEKLFFWTKKDDFATRLDEFDDLVIDIPAEAFGEDEQEGEVLGDADMDYSEERAYKLDKLVYIETEISRIARRTQVVSSEVDDYLEEQATMEELSFELEEISVQLELLSNQLQNLEVSTV